MRRWWHSLSEGSPGKGPRGSRRTGSWWWRPSWKHKVSVRSRSAEVLRCSRLFCSLFKSRSLWEGPHFRNTSLTCKPHTGFLASKWCNHRVTHQILISSSITSYKKHFIFTCLRLQIKMVEWGRMRVRPHEDVAKNVLNLTFLKVEFFGIPNKRLASSSNVRRSSYNVVIIA